MTEDEDLEYGRGLGGRSSPLLGSVGMLCGHLLLADSCAGGVEKL